MSVTRLNVRDALLLVASVAVSSGCVAHAPLRIRADETAPTAVTTSAAELADPVRRAEIARHSVEVHPDYTLAFVEFDDQGMLWNRAQIALLKRTLEEESSRAGAISIVLFAHGWKHNAGVCDTNVCCYRTMLGSLAKDMQAMERLSNRRVPAARPVGVYVGWRGLSQKVKPLTTLTFWARKRVAERIGGGELVELLTALDRFVSRKNSSGPRTASLTILGHSFGGTAVYTALANVLKARLVDARVRRELGEPDARVIPGYGDLVLLVNPAFEASLYAPIRELLSDFGPFSPFQPPILITLASETDTPNRTWFKLGRTLDTLSQKGGARLPPGSIVTAVGSYDPYITHRLRMAESAHVPRPKSDVIGSVKDCSCDVSLAPRDEGEMRRLTSILASSFERTAPQAEGSGEHPHGACSQGIAYGRTVLTCGESTNPLNPFWVVRASDEVIHGHSAFFTTGLIDFVRHAFAESLVLRFREAMEKTSRP